MARDFAFVGSTKFTPFESTVANRNSSYWKATERKRPTSHCFSNGEARLPEGRPGGRAFSRPIETLTGAGYIRRHLCALPLEQASEQAFRFFPQQGCAGSATRLLERLLEVDEERRIQAGDAADASRDDFLAGSYRPPNRVPVAERMHARRSRPTRSPATSGTTSRRIRTRACRRSARSPCTIR
jgi:hypothetical protein